MKLPIKRPWTPWYYSSFSVVDTDYSSQLGGYMEQLEIPKGYQSKPSNVQPGPGGHLEPSFYFATVKGAGHVRLFGLVWLGLAWLVKVNVAWFVLGVD